LFSPWLKLVFDLDQSLRGKVSKTVNSLNLIDQNADYAMEAGAVVLDGPGRREVAFWLFCLSHAADILRPCPI
jgi:hypothetical protein